MRVQLWFLSMIGKYLGHYRIVQKIGEGGMGVVYRARDERLDREVALKILPAGMLANETARQRFRKEALLLAKLNHPNIETVHDFDTDNGVDFLVMELIPGAPLSKRLASGPLGEKEILRLGAQFAEGLAAAHARGVIHRDLKPSNLMVAPDGHLKILDFGLARFLHPAADLEAAQSTESQAAAGTLPYMAPEQLQGEAADERSEIYAAGAVLYEMATDCRPFPETYGPRLIDAILHHSPPPPRQLNGRISPELESIILKALDKNPERRYQSATELRIDLERLLAPGETAQPSLLEQSQAPTLEMAHILFMDIVGYSKLPMERQQDVLRQLQRMVRGSAEFSRAQGNDELIRLPTGDGMALVFFGDPEAPVRCALELSRALRNQAEIPLRMGVHSGPVYRLADINANRNVAGGGINTAQRVMDCGDAGHILVSKTVADVLGQLSNWVDALHELGEAEVKHAARVHLYNIYTADAGNPEVPSKLWAATLAERRARIKRRVALGLAGGVVVTVLGFYFYRLVWSSHSHGKATSASAPVKLRRSVAVLGFKNLSGRSDEAWLSTALSEMLTTELASGGALRTIPGENVARMQLSLSLPDSDSYSAETLSKIRDNLGTDDIVLGSYVHLGKEAGGKIRMDLRLQDARNGETIATVWETGTESQLFDLVSRVSAHLREKLGLAEAAHAEANGVRASVSANPEAARLYAEGLSKLRVFDAQGARGLLEKAVAADTSFAQAHSALASAWSALGYGQKAIQEAGIAVDLSANLAREDQLSVEGQYRAATKEWSKAVEIYHELFSLFPDNVDYGLRLAAAQTSAGKAQETLSTLAVLHKLPSPVGDDPRIDLAEAAAADSLGDYKRELEAARRADQKGFASGGRLVVARGRTLQGSAFRGLGQNKQAMAALGEASELYSAAGDRGGRPLITMGAILAEQGDLARAKETFEQALGVAREIGNKANEAIALSDIAHVLADRGDLTAAKSIYVRALGIQREIEDKRNLGSTLSNLGHLLARLGNYSEAGKQLEESLAIAREVGNRRSEAYVLNFLGRLLYAEGNLTDSKARNEESLAIARDIGHKRVVESALSGIADVLLAQGDLVGAQKKQDEALATAKEIGEKGSAAQFRLALAEILLEKGLPTEAEAFAREPAEEFHNEKELGDEALALAVLARSLLAQNKIAGAKKALEPALAALKNTQDYLVQFDVGLADALVRAASGQTAAAETRLRAAVTHATTLGCVPCAFEARLALGQIETKSGKTADGRALLAAVEKDASAKGFLLIARNAATSSR